MGGKARAPTPPPPGPAPVRADSSTGEQGILAASRRQGLRKTMLTKQAFPETSTLGGTTALGKMGQGTPGVY